MNVLEPNKAESKVRAKQQRSPARWCWWTSHPATVQVDIGTEIEALQGGLQLDIQIDKYRYVYENWIRWKN